jgi:DNA-binding transcriptional LysR family regulator
MESAIKICRRVLTELEEAEIFANGRRSSSRGRLTLTSPVYTGETVLRPIVDGFLNADLTVGFCL